nr:hypothetical protein GCM10020092_105260 [Actinoplanes digitatis]
MPCCSSASGSRACPAACPPPPRWPPGPEPASRGCPGARATAARSTPSCLPNLLPGGRPVTDAVARAELIKAWGVEEGALPGAVGRDTDAIVAAAADGTLGALLVAGVDPADLADPRLAEQALDAVPFVVSLELRQSAVTRRADVVLPVAPAAEKPGTYMDWEG